MTRRGPIIFVSGAAAVALIALAVAGCGGDGDGATAATPSTTASGHGATISSADNGNLGTILVDSKERTLYLFEKDSGTTSACFGACASVWPPLRESGTATVGSGVDASIVGATARSDGEQQVTYNLHPLYLYAGDEHPGDTEGQGVTAFGGGWYALTPDGDEVSEADSSSEGGSGY